ncbi:hypothetical protein MAJJADAN_00034 [Pseudomonas phage Amjad_SA]|nr:hypothetical protein MAJJADAN_00034 [Pseudomonas phage Amjad_SA]
MQGLSASLTELKLTGNTGILPYLQALGVSVADANGKAKPLDDLLADIGDKLNALPNREDAFNIGRNLGIDEGTINLLLKGRAEVERLLASQRAYSDADAKAAREAAEKWEQAKLRIERASQALVISLLPVMERLVETTAEFVETITPGLEMVTNGFAELDEATDGWASTLAIALATLRLITGPGMIAGMGKLTAGLARLGAVGAAGAGGYAAGTAIYEKYVATDADLSDKIGGTIATILARFGNKDAQRALDQRFAYYPDASSPGGTAPAPQAGTPPYFEPPALPAPQVGASPESSPPILPTPQTGASRAQRNFNPGNLEFRGQAGAVPEAGDGRFAKFGSASEGVAALVRQLKLYDKRGLDTLDEIINTYAPSSENNTQAYIAQLSKALGVTGSQELDLNNPEVLSRLVKGISRHESGNDWLTSADVMTGLEMAGVSTSSTSTMTIGEVKVYTQASDANGIARDIRGALIRQADTGMR